MNHKVVFVSVPPEFQDPKDDYVGKLTRAVLRNATVTPLEFEVRTKNVYRGYWNKILLFPPKERIIFLDLDTVIVGNIDFLFEYQGEFAVLRDFYREKGYGSAIMSIAPGFGERISTDYTNDKTPQEFHGDQEWIKRWVSDADLWQDLYPGKIVSFKAHGCEQALPKDASIVCFHGEPRPAAMAHLDFMREHWS